MPTTRHSAYWPNYDTIKFGKGDVDDAEDVEVIWDSTSYAPGPPFCLRRVDTSFHWPEDDKGEVHRNGRVWSRALHDIHNALGRTVTDRIVLESHRVGHPGVTVPWPRSFYRHGKGEYDAVSLLWIILIVVLVLALLGFFSRSVW